MDRRCWEAWADWKLGVVLFLLSLFFFSIFSGTYALIAPDEGRYANIARAMLASGDFITPHINGTAFLDKPILFYWFEAALMRVFGVHEWSVRLLPAIMGALGCLLVYVAGQCLYNRRTAIIAALILMTSQFYFVMSHYANMDLMVAVFISGSLWSFIIAQRQARHQSRWMYLAYFFSALAFLSKGLIGIVFPIMIIGVFVAIRNRWRVVLSMCLPSGLLLFLALVLPWFICVQHANPEFMKYFFVIQQFSRFVSPHFNMHQPVFFYPAIIIVGIFPWTVFLLQALLFTAKSVVSKWDRADVQVYLLLWPLLILLFFSIPASKLSGYILPVFPPLALMIACYFDKHWDSLCETRHLRLCAFTVLIFMFCAAAAVFYMMHSPATMRAGGNSIIWALVCLLLVGGVVILCVALKCKRLMTFFLAMVLTIAIVDMAIILSVQHVNYSSVKPLATLVKEKAGPGDPIITYEYYFQDLPFYLQQDVDVVSGWSDKAALLEQDNWRRELAEDILYKDYQQPHLIAKKQLVLLWQQNKRVFLLTKPGFLSGLGKILPTPVYTLAHYRDSVLLSNQRD